MDKTVSASTKAPWALLLAARGAIPAHIRRGMEISGLEQAEALDGVKVFTAEQNSEKRQARVSSGGRVLCA